MKNKKHTKIKDIMRKYDLTYYQIARLVDLNITTVRYWNYSEKSFTQTHEFALLHRLYDRCNENIAKLNEDIALLKK